MKSDIDIYFTHLTNGIFSAEIPHHWRIVGQSKDIVVLKRIIWPGCADIFRTCPWSYSSQKSTNATQSNCACLKKKVSADRWLWRYTFENHFLIRLRRCLPVTRFRMCLYKPLGYQADDLRASLSPYAYRLYIFSLTFSRIKTALFMCTRIHVHAPIRLRRYISAASRQNLSWEWLNFCNLYKLWSDK